MTQSPDVTPAKQVAGFIAKFDPAVAKLARASRVALRKRLPTAAELVYDNYNALAVGYSSSERSSDCIVSLAVYACGVNLYFMYGATLPDPHKMLLGKGNQGRFVRLARAADLNGPEVEQLRQEAMRQSDPPLPKTGRGRTIIKSIATKQRPRRPDAPSRRVRR